ncbi:MAG: hypothetical protein HY721_01955, partial [Planctomycetes bacterium]|nr:hypothetical protein [Planctomycetota bacterium]
PPADLRVYAVGSHLEAERRAGIDSINFVLAGEKANDLLTPGVHTFDVKVSPAAGGFEELRERFEGQFRQSDRVHLLVVPIEVPDPAGTGSFVAPDPALLRSAADFLKVVYPLDEEEVLTMVQGTAVQATRSRFETNDERFELMRQVHDVRTAYLFGPDFHRAPGRDNVVFAVGVVPSRVGGSDTLGDAGGYSFSRELPGAAIVIDEPGFSSRAVAHEVGHLEGLGDEYLGGLVAVQNPPPRTAAEGDASGNFVTEAMGAFDLGFLGPGTRAVFGPPGPPFRGYMGVNDEPNWTTQVVYEFLYKQLTSIGGGGGGLPEPREAVHIAGSVSKAGELTLDPLLAGLTSADLPLPQGSIYTVQLRDAAGRTLSTFGFDPSFALEVLGADPTTENRYIEVDPSLFGFTVELPQGTETLAVLRGAGTLAEVRRSPSAPEVEITAAAVSLRTLEVTWDARDADGDALAFTVYYSPGGEDLQVVAVRSAERSLRARVGAAPGAGAFVSVHASDGFDFAMDKREIAATAVSRQLPGDCNQDGSLDVSDAVCVLLALFGGGPARLPCGDASASHSANAALLDWQGDGALDLSDAVASLQFLFRGSAPHVLSAAAGPEGCVAIEGCPEDLGCR